MSSSVLDGFRTSSHNDDLLFKNTHKRTIGYKKSIHIYKIGKLKCKEISKSIIRWPEHVGIQVHIACVLFRNKYMNNFP